jgi:hypothetical protein
MGVVIVETIKNFFIKPSAIFEGYKERPKWGLKLLVVTLIMGLFGLVSKLLTADIYPELLEKQLQNNPNKEQLIEQAVAWNNTPVSNIIAFISSFIVFAVMFLVICLVLWLIVKALGGKARYLQVVAIYGLASIATCIGLIFKTVFMFATNNLAFLNLEPTVSSILFENLDVFYLWSLVLMFIGLKTTFEMPEKKSILAISILWLLFLAFSFGIYLLGKGMA